MGSDGWCCRKRDALTCLKKIHRLRWNMRKNWQPIAKHVNSLHNFRINMYITYITLIFQGISISALEGQHAAPVCFSKALKTSSLMSFSMWMVKMGNGTSWFHPSAISASSLHSLYCCFFWGSFSKTCKCHFYSTEPSFHRHSPGFVLKDGYLYWFLLLWKPRWFCLGFHQSQNSPLFKKWRLRSRS